VALLSYVLEVFGEHTLSVRGGTGALGLSVCLLAATVPCAKTNTDAAPHLFRIRTFRSAVDGSFLTRLGHWRHSVFCFPLLYQGGVWIHAD